MLDLSNKLTVFVIKVGDNPNYNDCIEALCNQSCIFDINKIIDYTPMSRAFQEMLNRCKTPYYIQVDEDMILEPNAIEKMYTEFITQKKYAMCCYMLKDIHLDMAICGIKIYNTEIFKKYPYNFNHPSCEVEQLERMKRDGILYDGKEDIVGLHSPKWTNEQIFERYYNLVHKYRIYGYQWMGRLPKKLKEKWQSIPTDTNFYALAGALAGVFADHVIHEEKDANKKLRPFITLEGYLNEK